MRQTGLRTGIAVPLVFGTNGITDQQPTMEDELEVTESEPHLWIGA